MEHDPYATAFKDLKTSLAHYIGVHYNEYDYSMYLDEEDMIEELFNASMFNIKNDFESFKNDYGLDTTLADLDKIKEKDIDWEKVF